MGVQGPAGYSHFEEEVYFITLSSQKFPEKAESTLEPSTGFEHGAPGFGIQHHNHLAIEVNL